MRIAVDARELGGRPRGVGRFLAELLAVWRHDPGFGHQLELMLPPRLELDHELSPLACYTAPPAADWDSWWEQVTLPRALARSTPATLFSPGYTAPVHSPVPTVVAVHDLSFERHPEWFRPREALRRRLLTRHSAARAARLVVGSEFARRELEQCYGVDERRLVVAPYGVSERFRPWTGPQLGQLADSLGLGGPLVLSVGTLLDRRVPELLLHAWASLPERPPGARLWLVGIDRRRSGRPLLELADELGIASSLRLLEDVPEAQLPGLYSLAHLSIYLSGYEGFGLPPLEALACGCPLVASPVPSLLETPAADVSLVDERSLDSVRSALDQRLSRPRPPARPPAWIHEWSWSRTARLVQAALEASA